MSRTVSHVGDAGGGTAHLLPFLWPESAERQAGLGGTAAFALFILLNATLFVRPAEIVPSLEGWPIYAVIATLAVAIARRRSFRNSRCVRCSIGRSRLRRCLAGRGGFLAPLQLLHLGRRHRGTGILQGRHLLPAARRRDRQCPHSALLGWLVALTVVATGLAVLQYHGLIDIPALAAIEQGAIDPETGDAIVVMRLVSTGIFNDPNDLCLLLIVAIAACVHGLEDRRWNSWRMLWIRRCACLLTR